MITYFTANTTSRLLVRVFTQKTQIKPYAASAAVTASSNIGLIIFGLRAANGEIFSAVTPTILFILISIAIMSAYFGKLSMTAQKHVDTASYMVLRQVSVPTSVLISTLTLNEGMEAIQILGMFVILSGSYIVGSGGKRIKISNFGRYQLQILAYGLFLGLYSISARLIEQRTSLSTLLVLGGACEIVIAIQMAWRESKSQYSKSDFIYIILIGLGTTVHVVSF